MLNPDTAEGREQGAAGWPGWGCCDFMGLVVGPGKGWELDGGVCCCDKLRPGSCEVAELRLGREPPRSAVVAPSRAGRSRLVTRRSSGKSSR